MPEETCSYKGYTLSVYVEDEIADPRKDQDNLWTLACAHRRYKLGDIRPDDIPKEWSKKTTRVKKLYLYDHSGITIATTPFSCPWDSGVIGIALLTLAKAKKEYGGVTWTSVLKDGRTLAEACDAYLESEIKEYDRFLSGEEVFYFSVKDESGEFLVTESGYDSANSAMQAAKETIDKEYTHDH